MTTKHPRWQPDFAVLPGATVKETLNERGLTQDAAAAAMGISASYISDVIRGHRSLTPRFAIRLEKLTGVDAQVWVNLQAGYDLAIERRAFKP